MTIGYDVYKKIGNGWIKTGELTCSEELVIEIIKLKYRKTGSYQDACDDIINLIE